VLDGDYSLDDAETLRHKRGSSEPLRNESGGFAVVMLFISIPKSIREESRTIQENEPSSAADRRVLRLRTIDPDTIQFHYSRADGPGVEEFRLRQSSGGFRCKGGFVQLPGAHRPKEGTFWSSNQARLSVTADGDLLLHDRNYQEVRGEMLIFWSSTAYDTYAKFRRISK